MWCEAFFDLWLRSDMALWGWTCSEQGVVWDAQWSGEGREGTEGEELGGEGSLVMKDFVRDCTL